jgi:hypothetical protein
MSAKGGNLLPISEVRRTTKWISLYIYKGLSRLLSADSTRHDKPGEQIGGYERWK